MIPPMVMMVSVSATVSATPILNEVTTSQLFTSFWICTAAAAGGGVDRQRHALEVEL